MNLEGLLLISLASGALQLSSPPPIMTVESVLPPAHGAATCAVTVRNSHDRSAVAWILVAERGSLRHGNDAILDPQQSIAPSSTGTLSFPCSADFTPAGDSIVVAAVQFDDGTIAGDTDLFSLFMQRWRVQQLAGFQQLASMLSLPQISAMEAAPDAADRLERIIDNSSGPAIDAVVKSHATAALRRHVSVKAWNPHADVIATLRRHIDVLSRFTRTQR